MIWREKTVRGPGPDAPGHDTGHLFSRHQEKLCSVKKHALCMLHVCLVTAAPEAVCARRLPLPPVLVRLPAPKGLDTFQAAQHLPGFPSLPQAFLSTIYLPSPVLDTQVQVG